MAKTHFLASQGEGLVMGERACVRGAGRGAVCAGWGGGVRCARGWAVRGRRTLATEGPQRRCSAGKSHCWCGPEEFNF